jgi:hypothetical protein
MKLKRCDSDFFRSLFLWHNGSGDGAILIYYKYWITLEEKDFKKISGSMDGGGEERVLGVGVERLKYNSVEY